MADHAGPTGAIPSESQAQLNQEIEALRDYLRQPEHRIRSTDPESKHQIALSGIWERALTLTNGDREQALHISVEATRSSRQPEESSQDYHQRLDGIPSRAFGSAKPFTGEDKPQHFFATAHEAYMASISTMDFDPLSNTWSRPATGVGEALGQLIGRTYEVGDWVRSLATNTGGYDRGDVRADDRGAAFGAALAAGLVAPDQINPNAAPISIMDYLGVRDDPDSTRNPTPPVLDRDTAFLPDARVERDTSPAEGSGSGPTSTPMDANLTNEQGQAVHAEGSRSGPTSTPMDANLTNEQGQAVHVEAGGSAAASTPADANYMTDQGQAVHEGSPPDSGDSVFDDMADDTY